MTGPDWWCVKKDVRSVNDVLIAAFDQSNTLGA